MYKRGYFELEELVDKETFEKYGEDCWNLFHEDLLYFLNGVRDFFDAPVTVNNWLWGGPFQYRGYRGANCTIGALYSYHKRGMAVDFDVKGYSAHDARSMIVGCQNLPGLDRIMRMERDVNWVHLDVGTLKKGQKRIYLFYP